MSNRVLKTTHPHPFPSQHADAYGHDQYGYWQSLVLFGVPTRFRWIAPGAFGMGSPETEVGRRDNEVQHEVTLTQGYWLAETACSQALWRAVCGDSPSRFKGDDLPVEKVSWDDIKERFIGPLAQSLTDMQPTLPSEAQWEYACRAGTTTVFNFGDELTTDLANYHGGYPYANGPKGEHRRKTLPVSSFIPNAWGLYQMHGNVWEWCEDGYDNYSEKPVTDPIGWPEASRRVLRGGSWSNGGRHLRSAYRLPGGPGLRDNDVGFRLAQVPVSK